jgi:hypothetical protein
VGDSENHDLRLVLEKSNTLPEKLKQKELEAWLKRLSDYLASDRF